MTDLNNMTRKFLLGEGVVNSVNPSALLQAINEALSSLRPSSRRDENRIAVAKKQLREVKLSFRRLQEQVNILEEKLQVLEEASTMAGGSVEVGVSGVSGPFGDMSSENEKEKKRSKTK